MSDRIESMLGCEVTREADPVVQNQDSGLAVQQAFEELRGPTDDKVQSLARLFADLNYQVVLEPLSVTGWPKRAQEVVAHECPTPPQILAAAGQRGQFKVIYVPLQPGQRESARLRLTDERAVAQQVLSERAFPDSLLVFSNPEQRHWHFVNPHLISGQAREARQDRRPRYVLRRIAVGPEDKLRTAVDRFSRIGLIPSEADTLLGPQIHDKHNEAFNVEKVTDEFFQGFKDRFQELQELLGATGDPRWAHDYALRLLSRVMFVYFIQRKRWLGDDPDFMTHYWQAYAAQRGHKRTGFFSQWLEPLFFEAFASPAEASLVNKRDYMPADLRETLRNAPYLNGGLFSRDDLDLRHSSRLVVHDEFFEGLLDPADGFFERYNFTISEDSPLDQEVAVDPEMIGRVYESLVNISEPGSEAAEDRDRQREAGIFYTPRTEIDLMCRLALSDYLRNHLGDEHRDLIYELLFSLEPDEKAHADQVAADLDLWPRLGELIRGVTVVDPACGSGSFLVGMMNVLFDLRQRAAAQLGMAQTENEAKREIIGYNLYGVDVMQWAVEIAELRLWLQLVVHTELEPGELQGPRPLLPNLSFKIRQGDSLVQEVAGVNLAHLKTDVTVPSALRGRLRRLQAHKLAFYEAKEHYFPEAEDQIREEERKLFLDILGHKATALEQQVQRIIARLGERQRKIDGTEENAASPEERQELEQQREQLEAQLESVRQAHAAILKAKQLPFVWDLAFVEVFEGDTRGFDIVIGNPPYVRQERIANPEVPCSEQSKEDRACYKAALERSVYAAYPSYFGPDPGRPRVKLSGRSDLYVYFYFHSLSLLNDRGAFCFITSNSWLDVGYGAALQEFLARQVPIHLILDNRVKRSFAQADVNTVIALFGAPNDKQRDVALDHTARFVMVHVPFEEILHPVVFEEIDAAAERITRPEFKVYPITQRELLERGLAMGGGGEEEEERARPRRRKGRKSEGPLIVARRYHGDKWGGKYLRAPDIYYEILEAAGDKLVPLGEIAEVRRGFTTGANDFFYVRAPGGVTTRTGEVPIETDAGTIQLFPAEMLEPAIVRPGSIVQPRLTRQISDYLLVCIPPLPVSRLPRSVRDYIKWGKAKKYDKRTTLAGRRFWYCIEPREPGPILTPMARKRRALVGWNVGRLQVDHNLFEVIPQSPQHARFIAGALMSTFTVLQAELLGRPNLGMGALKTEGIDIMRFLVPDPSTAAQSGLAGVERTFDALATRRILMIYDEVRREDRRALDEAVLTAVGVTNAGERQTMTDQLCDKACRMVWDRMAKSANAREARMTYDEWLASGEPFDAAAEEDVEEDL